MELNKTLNKTFNRLYRRINKKALKQEKLEKAAKRQLDMEEQKKFMKELLYNEEFPETTEKGKRRKKSMYDTAKWLYSHSAFLPGYTFCRIVEIRKFDGPLSDEQTSDNAEVSVMYTEDYHYLYPCPFENAEKVYYGILPAKVHFNQDDEVDYFICKTPKVKPENWFTDIDRCYAVKLKDRRHPEVARLYNKPEYQKNMLCFDFKKMYQEHSDEFFDIKVTMEDFKNLDEAASIQETNTRREKYIRNNRINERVLEVINDTEKKTAEKWSKENLSDGRIELETERTEQGNLRTVLTEYIGLSEEHPVCNKSVFFTDMVYEGTEFAGIRVTMLEHTDLDEETKARKEKYIDYDSRVGDFYNLFLDVQDDSIKFRERYFFNDRFKYLEKEKIDAGKSEEELRAEAEAAAERYNPNMPNVPEGIFINHIETLLKNDTDWLKDTVMPEIKEKGSYLMDVNEHYDLRCNEYQLELCAKAMVSSLNFSSAEVEDGQVRVWADFGELNPFKAQRDEEERMIQAQIEYQNRNNYLEDIDIDAIMEDQYAECMSLYEQDIKDYKEEQKNHVPTPQEEELNRINGEMQLEYMKAMEKQSNAYFERLEEGNREENKKDPEQVKLELALKRLFPEAYAKNHQKRM